MAMGDPYWCIDAWNGSVSVRQAAGFAVPSSRDRE